MQEEGREGLQREVTWRRGEGERDVLHVVFWGMLLNDREKKNDGSFHALALVLSWRGFPSEVNFPWERIMSVSVCLCVGPRGLC